MTERTPHPDFLEAPEENRWTGTLPQLAKVLKHEAYQLQGEWAWRILPRGALVAICVPPTFRKQLRIARRLRKGLTGNTAKAWHTEVRNDLEEIGCEDWKAIKDVIEPGDPPKLEVVYEEPLPLGAKLNQEKCVHCDQPATKGVYKEAVCLNCARILGTKEADARRQEVEERRRARQEASS